MMLLVPMDQGAADSGEQWKTWSALVVILAGSLVAAAVGGGVAAGFAFGSTGQMPDFAHPLAIPGFLALSIAGSEIALLGGVLLLPLVFGDAPQGLKSRLGWRLERVTVSELVLLTVAMVAVGSVEEGLFQAAGWWTGPLAEIGVAVSRAHPVEFAALIVVGGLLAGFAEEFVFRGLLQRKLTQTWGPRKAILTASVCFGLFHLDPVHSTVAFGLGVLLGWAAWRSDTVVLGVMAHALNNVTSFALSRAGVPSPPPLLAISVGAVVAVAAIVLLHRRLPRA